MGASSPYGVVSNGRTQSPPNHNTAEGDDPMKQLKQWKVIVLTALLPLLIAAQPALAAVCDVAGSHTGC